MGFVAHSPPDFSAAKAAYNIDPAPVHTSKFVSLPLFSKVNGIMNMVFAYGGAMIFPEFMAEMKRPMDFWKAMVRQDLVLLHDPNTGSKWQLHSAVRNCSLVPSI